MSEIICLSWPPPASAITFTFEHFAASERTAAYDSCDQVLTPKPSSIPSVIGFVPQNGMFGWIPVEAISCCAVGHVIVTAATALPAPTIVTSAASPTARREMRDRRPTASVRSLVPIASSLDPG